MVDIILRLTTVQSLIREVLHIFSGICYVFSAVCETESVRGFRCTFLDISVKEMLLSVLKPIREICHMNVCLYTYLKPIL